MQRRMAGLALEQSKVFMREALQLIGHCFKTLPKPLRCGMYPAQSVLAAPLRWSASASAAS
jgi:hypothetical protein